jgi:peptide/histidine transporter 3/4
MMVSLTVIVYVQANINWAIGLGIPTLLMFFSCAFFFVGSRIYVKVLPEGSPLTSVAQVLIAAAKKRKLKLPEQPWLSLFNHVNSTTINAKLSYTDQFQFLNKASIITEKDQMREDGSAVNPWRICSTQQVEEVKCLVRVVPIWAAGIIYFVSLTQMGTYAIFQALQLDRRLGRSGFKIPAASYTVYNMLSLTIWIPIYDRIIVPFLRKRTKKEGGITILQKIGIGMFLAIITMLVAAIVETKRRHIALTRPTLGMEPRKGEISSMSGSWLVPQLAIAGLSEAFAVIGLVEFFYKQFPENMRSFGGSFLFCAFAMASYLSSFIISVVHKVTGDSKGGNWLAEDLNKAKLDNFYYMIAGLEVLNLGYFLVCSKWYQYKGTAGTDELEVGMEKVHSSKPIV